MTTACALPATSLAADEKDYSTPALEIIGFDLLLNQFNRRALPGNDYDTSWSSVRRNLRSSWTVENDPFKINQLGHPYQGSMYHGFARSAGLSYWESSLYTFAGSAFWEIAGETTQPSRNDQVASGIGGSFLGESLYRMASLLLERGEGTKLWREVGAAAISPSLGFNRLAFNRFDAIFASRHPAYYSRFAVALSGTTQNEQNLSQPSCTVRNAVTALPGARFGSFANLSSSGKPVSTIWRPSDLARAMRSPRR